MENNPTLFKTRLLKRKQFIPRSLQETFEFFKKPENLALITPPWLSFNVLTPSPIPMRTGQLIDYTVRVAGIQVLWTSAILDYQEGKGFVDVQVRGPYAFWHHRHTFREDEGGVWAEDEVRYSSPGGILEPIINFFFVRPQLNSIFYYRKKKIADLLG